MRSYLEQLGFSAASEVDVDVFIHLQRALDADDVFTCTRRGVPSSIHGYARSQPRQGLVEQTLNDI